MTWALQSAWILWVLSLVLALASHYASTLAMDKAVRQVDSGEVPAAPGGCYDRLTRGLNATSGLAFVIGAVFICIFMICNA